MHRAHRADEGPLQDHPEEHAQAEAGQEGHACDGELDGPQGTGHIALRVGRHHLETPGGEGLALDRPLLRRPRARDHGGLELRGHGAGSENDPALGIHQGGEPTLQNPPLCDGPGQQVEGGNAVSHVKGADGPAAALLHGLVSGEVGGPQD
ncbi:MAG TPA: hypothetical protein PKO12_00830, partial [Holophaga sp.]|nr:hypothetical protein [Holophaga sp.]